jgi:glycosyltransferase involved in cell wall biosynthesis
MSASPRVSVVVPTLRRPQRLWRALASVGTQDYPDVELIVVNDGGVNVGAVVARYEREYTRPACYIDLPVHHGVAAARNAGVAAASGAILAFLDDDDRYLPDHLARMVAVLVGQPEAALVYEDILIEVEAVDSDDAEPSVIATCRMGLPYDEQIFNRDDYIPPSVWALRRETFDAIGGFDESLTLCEDWDFLLRLRRLGALSYIPGAIGTGYSVRQGGGEHLGGTFDAERRRTLDYLSATYGLPPLVPKTFLDVARDLGFTLTPTGT